MILKNHGFTVPCTGGEELDFGFCLGFLEHLVAVVLEQEGGKAMDLGLVVEHCTTLQKEG